MSVVADVRASCPPRWLYRVHTRFALRLLHQEVRITKSESGVEKVTAVCCRRSLGNSVCNLHPPTAIILEHEDLVDI
jgi:hypothetical protein